MGRLQKRTRCSSPQESTVEQAGRKRSAGRDPRQCRARRQYLGVIEESSMPFQRIRQNMETPSQADTQTAQPGAMARHRLQADVKAHSRIAFTRQALHDQWLAKRKRQLKSRKGNLCHDTKEVLGQLTNEAKGKTIGSPTTKTVNAFVNLHAPVTQLRLAHCCSSEWVK